MTATDTTSRLEIAKAITRLRNQQLATELPELKAEKQTEIDALLAKWADAR